MAKAKKITAISDTLVKTDNYISKGLMKDIKNQTAKQAGMKKFASGISVSQPQYYSPLLTPTSLQLPRDRKQTNVWLRHFYMTEALPAAIIDLYASLPITGYKIICSNPYYKKYIEDMVKRLHLRTLLQGISLEFWQIGDVFIMGELDVEKSDWKRFVVLNPDQVEVQTNMLISEPHYEMIPDDNIRKLVHEQQPREQYFQLQAYAPEVIQAVRAGRNIPIDPAHITHLKHMPVPYGVYGTPLLKRIFKTLMYKEMIRRAQFTIAQRYVMPLKIFKLGTIDEPPEQAEIDAMQAQLTQVLNDPSLILVTSQRFNADWQGIAGKTLSLNGEYDFLERETIAGLGAPRAFLDGVGGTYANSSVGGNAFLQKIENFRLTLKEFIDEKIIKPIAELNGWYDRDPDTDEEYLVVPEFQWEAMRLQDEITRQNTIMELRNMKHVSAKTLLEAVHIDPETEAQNLIEERDTIFDVDRIAARQQAIFMGQNSIFQKKMMQDQYGVFSGQDDGTNPLIDTNSRPFVKQPPLPHGSVPKRKQKGDDLSGFESSKSKKMPNKVFAPLDRVTNRAPVSAALEEVREAVLQVKAKLKQLDEE